jgi:DNA-binding NarL/FixJ family response regulator
MAARKIKLLLADDHAIVRQGIRSSLAGFPSISVIGEAQTGKEAVRMTRRLAPDVVLMDLNMPDMSGLEATPLVLKSCPATKVLALTVHDNKEYVFEMLRAGAHGYVLKDTSPQELVHAVEAVMRGQAFFSPRVSSLLLENFREAPSYQSPKPNSARLSEREQQILQSIAQGATGKEIASRLKLSIRTVETYRVRLKRKLGARNIADLLTRARQQGVL